MKNKLILILFLLVLPFNVNAKVNNLKEEYQSDLYKAKVLEVIETVKTKDTEIQMLKIVILNKNYRNHESIIKNTLTGNGYDLKIKKGDRISVHLQLNDNEPTFYFNNYEKSIPLLIMFIIFTICIVILGGFKGLKALISLVFTISIIIFGLIPLLLNGHNPIVLSIITCIIASVVTFIITNGFTKKSLNAIVGVTGGLLVVSIIAYIFTLVTRITGFSSENAQMLQYLPNGSNFDFKGLLFAGIMIGALGACMDVAIEITFALTEIKKHHPNISDKELIKSGFNIGKDIMGTMVNTLILAYTGGSLATILIFVGFNKSLNETINLDSVAMEIIRAMSGSMGLLFAIPFTIFGFVFINKKRSDKN